MLQWFSARRVSALVVVLLLSLVVAACGGQAAPSTGREPAAQPQDAAVHPAPAEEAQETAYPLTLTDATGVEVTFEAEPQRIISLLPSNTEILYALGLGDNVVGVTKWDNYPPEVKEKEVVGGLEPDAEKILSLEPDLVLVGASANAASIEPLRDLGLPLFAVEAKSFSEVQEVIRQVGLITNAQAAAEQVVEEMEQARREVTDAVAGLSEEEKPLVWVEISPAPDIFTAGRGTFMDELIRLAGGRNLAGDIEGWAQYSIEKVIEANPDVILVTYGYYVENATEQVKNRQGFDAVTAVQKDRIYEVDSDITNRPGPRLAEALKIFAERIHPELFE